MAGVPKEPNEKKLFAKLTAKSTADPILRNALRYTISAKEYEALHRYVLSRTKMVGKRVPTVSRFEEFVSANETGESIYGVSRQAINSEKKSLHIAREDNNAAMIRESLRVFLGSTLILKSWSTLRRMFVPGKKTIAKAETAFWRSSHIRQSFSLGMILLLHRLLFRFFIRIRTYLLAPAAAPFRRRNTIISKALTSRYTPAIGASFAGLALKIYPPVSSRVTIAVYALSQAADFTYDLAEEKGWIWKDGKPTWWGRWLLFPVASGQLLLAFVYDRDCFPRAYGEFILNSSPSYIQSRPDSYPAFLPWPSMYTIVDSLAIMGRQNYPNLISPIIFPESKPNIPSIAPITNAAHPLITHLSCATLHPSDPSCLRTYLKNWITTFPKLIRFFTIVFSILWLPRFILRVNGPKNIMISFQLIIGRFIERIIRYSVFVSGAIGTSWASICLFQLLFPRTFLAEKRFFLGGFLGGLWAWIVRYQAHSEFSYSMRASLVSCWQVGQKRGWWKGFQDGDVLVFTFSLAALNLIYDYDRDRSVAGESMVWRVLGGARGYGWRNHGSLHV